MPTQIKYIDGGIGVEYISSGVVTGADIIAANRAVYENENFRKQKYQLVDRTNCTEFNVSYEEMRIIALQDKAAAGVNPNIIIALVAITDMQYGMSRVYETYVGDGGFSTAIFRDRKSAEEWIANQLNKSNKDIKSNS